MNWTVETGNVWKDQRERRVRLLLTLMLGFRVTGSPQFVRGASSVDDDIKCPDFLRTLPGLNQTHLWARFGPQVADWQACLRERHSPCLHDRSVMEPIGARVQVLEWTNLGSNPGSVIHYLQLQASEHPLALTFLLPKMEPVGILTGSLQRCIQVGTSPVRCTWEMLNEVECSLESVLTVNSPSCQVLRAYT